MLTTSTACMQFEPLHPYTQGEFQSFVPASRNPLDRDIIRDEPSFSVSDYQAEFQLSEDSTQLRIKVSGRTPETERYIRFFELVIKKKAYFVEVLDQKLVIWQADYGWRRIFEIDLPDKSQCWMRKRLSKTIRFNADVKIPVWNGKASSSSITLCLA